MPIDPDFQVHRRAEAYGNLKVWRNNNSESVLGIYGTSVAVDFDLCVGDGACMDVCPADVFEWHGDEGGAERKAMPKRERDCTYCYGCEAVCPKSAIRITPFKARG